jgi:hypothetical protein
MLNAVFVGGLATGLFALLFWGVRTLPAERWQMLASIPITKVPDGSWRGLNLTFYGLFSATGTVFGFAIMLLLLASVGIPGVMGVAVVLMVLLVCVPASRLIAGFVEKKRNTFTVAGAAFVASILLPWVVLATRPVIVSISHATFAVLPVFAATAIGYALGESIGRLACLSFGCCYGMPVRNAAPLIARLFQKHNLTIHGSTKKASYASGLAGEPLVPVQAITSAVFAVSGLAGLAFFLIGQFRAAAVIPIMTNWGWRACSEWLRADYRGNSKISAYQLMAVLSAVYLSAFVVFLPDGSSGAPNLAAAFAQLSSAPTLIGLEVLWVGLFLYYGRSRVTASTLSFHVVADQI